MTEEGPVRAAESNGGGPAGAGGGDGLGLSFSGFLRGVLNDCVSGHVERRTDRVRDAAMTVAEVTGRTDDEALAWVLSRRPGWVQHGAITRGEFDAVVDEAVDESRER